MELNPMAATQRPLSILIAALGGEGGGVLADWIIAAATAEDYPVQSTSIPRGRAAHRRDHLLCRDLSAEERATRRTAAADDARTRACQHRRDARLRAARDRPRAREWFCHTAAHHAYRVYASHLHRR